MISVYPPYIDRICADFSNFIGGVNLGYPTILDSMFDGYSIYPQHHSFYNGLGVVYLYRYKKYFFSGAELTL